jgi:hypothetical protein
MAAQSVKAKKGPITQAKYMSFNAIHLKVYNTPHCNSVKQKFE